jgi:hypothetical protein
MTVLIDVPFDRLPQETIDLLNEIQQIYHFGTVTGAIAWAIEPDISQTICRAVRHKIKFARSYLRNHGQDE